MLLPIITAIGIGAWNWSCPETGDGARCAARSAMNQHSDLERKLSLTHLADGETEPHPRFNLYTVKPEPILTYFQPSLTPRRFRIMATHQISRETSST